MEAKPSDEELEQKVSRLEEAVEHNRMEEALQEEREKAQGYLDIAGVILVAITTEGEVTLINRKGCEVLGYEQEEMIKRNWFDNFLPKRSAKAPLGTSSIKIIAINMVCNVIT